MDRNLEHKPGTKTYFIFIYFWQDGLAEKIKVKLTKVDRFKVVREFWIDGERNVLNDDWKWRNHIQYFSGKHEVLRSSYVLGKVILLLPKLVGLHVL